MCAFRQKKSCFDAHSPLSHSLGRTTVLSLNSIASVLRLSDSALFSELTVEEVTRQIDGYVNGWASAVNMRKQCSNTPQDMEW